MWQLQDDTAFDAGRSEQIRKDGHGYQGFINKSLFMKPSADKLQACDSCKKKKIRCNAALGSCTPCTKSNIECTFSPAKTKEGPRRPPGYAICLPKSARLTIGRYKHVEKLEERLKRMEGLLEAELRGGTSGVGHQLNADLPLDVVENSPRSKSPDSHSGMKRKRGKYFETPSSVERHVSVSPYGTDFTLATMFETFKLTYQSLGQLQLVRP